MYTKLITETQSRHQIESDLMKFEYYAYTTIEYRYDYREGIHNKEIDRN